MFRLSYRKEDNIYQRLGTHCEKVYPTNEAVLDRDGRVGKRKIQSVQSLTKMVMVFLQMTQGEHFLIRKRLPPALTFNLASWAAWASSSPPRSWRSALYSFL